MSSKRTIFQIISATRFVNFAAGDDVLGWVRSAEYSKLWNTILRRLTLYLVVWERWCAADGLGYKSRLESNSQKGEELVYMQRESQHGANRDVFLYQKWAVCCCCFRVGLQQVRHVMVYLLRIYSVVHGILCYFVWLP